MRKRPYLKWIALSSFVLFVVYTKQTCSRTTKLPKPLKPGCDQKFFFHATPKTGSKSVRALLRQHSRKCGIKPLVVEECAGMFEMAYQVIS